MSLDSLLAQIGQYQSALPPVEQWSPSQQGEIDIYIDADGQWFYQESLFTRQKLVQLLASILVFEGGDYWLKTPAEQLKIKVEDVPFVVNQWQWLDDKANGLMVLTTNIGQQCVLSSGVDFVTKNERLYLPVQRNLLAKVHRNVFYQWAEIASEATINDELHWVIESDGKAFSLGTLTRFELNNP